MAMQQGKASSRRTTRLACKPTRGICRLLRASIPTVVGPAARGGVPGPGARFLRFCVIQCIGSNFESERVCEGYITLIR